MRVFLVRVLRALLPSWRFFDQIEPAPVLSLRFAARGAELSAWAPALARPRRGLFALLLNPAGNLALAEHALLEQLLGDLAEPSVQSAQDAEQLTSYALVAHLAQQHAASKCASEEPEHALGRASKEQTPGLRFQFRLDVLADGGLGEELLLSRVHEI